MYARKSLKRPAKYLFYGILTLCLFVQCSYPKKRKSVDPRLSGITSVAILPPDVDMVEATFTGKERKPQHKDKVSKNVEDALRLAMEYGGLDVKSTGLTHASLVENQDLAFGLTKARRSFAAAIDIINAQTGGDIESEEGRFVRIPVDPEIGHFADLAQADYLLMVRGRGFKSSDTKSLVDFVRNLKSGKSNGRQSSGLTLEVGIIDASTAELIWFNRNTSEESDYNPLDARDVDNLCKALLQYVLEHRPIEHPKRPDAAALGFYLKTRAPLRFITTPPPDVVMFARLEEGETDLTP